MHLRHIIGTVLFPIQKRKAIQIKKCILVIAYSLKIVIVYFVPGLPVLFNILFFTKIIKFCIAGNSRFTRHRYIFPCFKYILAIPSKWLAYSLGVDALSIKPKVL